MESSNVYRRHVRVILNGESRDYGDGVTVAQLLQELGLQKRRIAVEINRGVVQRETYEQQALHDGDVVEVIHFIGGG